MTDRTFVDTNILVYAHDIDAGNRHESAKRAITELWENRSGVLSTQVIQEFYVTLTRKIPTPLKKSTVIRIIKSFLNWDIVINDAPIILQAFEIEETYNLSFWDALIVSAAYSRNVTTILTEDLNHGQSVEGMLIVNPFMKETPRKSK